ncbi:MAG: NAD(P)H-binding protein [Bacteroidales bacterium]|nr:NAD(P)H-binding protein [Bacteroidales bacterium]
MSQKILLIGGTGMLGKPVARKLKEAGYQVRIFSRSVSEKEEQEGFEIFRGDFFNPEDLDRALKECTAIHTNLAKVDEGAAMRVIVAAAKRAGIETISCISGASVCEENRWFPITEQKYQAEQSVINSGIPYMIFRPSWFFESLELMVRGGKAMMIGKQPHPYRWVAVEDYARMVAAAYLKSTSENPTRNAGPGTLNQIYYILGPEYHRMRDLMVRYIKAVHPEIKKVSDVPLWMMKLIGTLSGKREMKMVAALYGYFEKAREQGDPAFTNKMLGAPGTTFEEWVKAKKR